MFGPPSKGAAGYLDPRYTNESIRLWRLRIPEYVKAMQATAPTQTAPPLDPASAAPDEVQSGSCSGESRWRLELADHGDRIVVRFKVLPSLDHRWRIVLRHGRAGPDPFNYGDGRVFLDGIRSEHFLFTSIEVNRIVRDLEGNDGFAAKAVDQETGQVCKAVGVI
jgi:hypothetical protein